MKTKFTKTGRIADTEVIIHAECPVSSQQADFAVQELVKKTAVELAKEMKLLASSFKRKEKLNIPDIPPQIPSLADALSEETPLRLRKS